METYESSSCGGISGCRARPEQATDDEEDYADEGLARVDDCATAEFVGGQGPQHDGKEVAAAKEERINND